MANWENININTNMIKKETDKSVLIACPHNSDYDGWSFWHPKKCIKNGRHSAAVSMGFTSDFSFTLRNKRGDTQVLTSEDIKEIFGVVDSNIVAKNSQGL